MTELLLFLSDVGSFLWDLTSDLKFRIGFGVGALIFLHIGDRLARAKK